MVTRLPAIPLVCNDPYFSVWCAADRLTDAESTHWSGAEKPLRASATVDGQPYRLLGLGDAPAMPTASLEVTPTQTIAAYEAGGVRVTLRFASPLLPEEPDVLSAPITLVDLSAESADGQTHRVCLRFEASSALCYDGTEQPPLLFDRFVSGGLPMAYVGQRAQRPLSHSGDHITIDWGYLYLAGQGAEAQEDGLSATLEGETPLSLPLLLGYDDIASIRYFGRMQPAWHARGGETLPQALQRFHQSRDSLLAECASLDERLMQDAREMGGEDYALIVSAAFRQTVAAHKLIADEEGNMVFLSKENDSNGCIGTVDVSYPSIPLFLLFDAEYVRAMCRPVLRFAALPVWEYDFAPHDVGRYPQATGQVYAAKRRSEGIQRGDVFPPYYLYPAGTEAYDFRYQMPVEECGNMLLMLAAAAHKDGDYTLVREHMPTLQKWVKFLLQYGEDPGDQLCTDDFAGHLRRNVNLSAKATMGVAAFGLLCRGVGDEGEARMHLRRAKEMAESWLRRSRGAEGTALTFDGDGWSMKYNLVWDRLFGLGLLPDAFYEEETKSYLGRMNEFGLPLDSRADYTKSDWILWVASMAPEEDFLAFVRPVAEFLRRTESRVPFSDWYDTKTGRYCHFIARSVQGGLFMPLVMRLWADACG